MDMSTLCVGYIMQSTVCRRISGDKESNATFIRSPAVVDEQKECRS